MGTWESPRKENRKPGRPAIERAQAGHGIPRLTRTIPFLRAFIAERIT